LILTLGAFIYRKKPAGDRLDCRVFEMKKTREQIIPKLTRDLMSFYVCND